MLEVSRRRAQPIKSFLYETQPASLPYKCKARLRVKLGPRAVQLARQLFPPVNRHHRLAWPWTVSCHFRTSTGATCKEHRGSQSAHDGTRRLSGLGNKRRSANKARPALFAAQ